MGSQKVRHNWASFTHTTNLYWGFILSPFLVFVLLMEPHFLLMGEACDQSVYCVVSWPWDWVSEKHLAWSKPVKCNDTHWEGSACCSCLLNLTLRVCKVWSYCCCHFRITWREPEARADIERWRETHWSHSQSYANSWTFQFMSQHISSLL